MENILFKGENLEITKRLLNEYEGKIRCICIDPPYNTKQKYTHYNDNLEHSLWLNMLKERLLILHRLLSENGSIWISIDDSECHYLKVLCDEIFGRKNFLANIIWQKKYSPQNDARFFSDMHDHILVYAKNLKSCSINLLPRTDKMDGRYKNPDNDPRGVWKSCSLSVKKVTPKDIYPIITPSGREVWPPSGSSWRLSKKRFEEFVRDNRILFGKTGNNVPSIKRFLSEVKNGITPKSLWLRDEVGDNQEAKRETKIFNSDSVFTTPKPERLLQRIIHLATDPGDIVLDSFAGSGTTGAVAHKMGRRWIMIELGEHCHTHIIPRMEKVIEGEDSGGVTEMVNWKGGGSYKFINLKNPSEEGKPYKKPELKDF